MAQNPRVSLGTYSNLQPVEKSYFTFVAGLNTDASPLNFPDNFSSDEENFVLNIDGSRQRRKGLALETGGAAVTSTEIASYSDTPTIVSLLFQGDGFQFTYEGTVYTFYKDSSTGDITLSYSGGSKAEIPFTKLVIGGNTYNTSAITGFSKTFLLTTFSYVYTWSEVGTWPALSTTPAFDAYTSTLGQSGIVRAHYWRNVDGDPDLNVLVLQNGQYVTFFTDAEVISTATQLGELDLTDFAAPSATDAQIQTSPINVDYGRGHLFIVGEYIEPIRVEWDGADVIARQIEIRERDFKGIDDGITDTAQPSALISSHVYNLLNQGWTQANLDTFLNDATNNPNALYPAKNMVQWMGLQAAGDADTTVTTDFDVKSFSPAKLLGELFQDAPAPTGHFIINPFDTTVVSVGSTGFPIPISTWSVASTAGGSTACTIRLSADHGAANGDDVVIEGQLASYRLAKFVREWSFDGAYTITLTGQTVTAATNADPAVLTIAGHPFQVGDTVTLSGFSGGTWNTEDGNVYAITAKDTNTITLGALNSTSLGTFSAGTVTPANWFVVTVDFPSSFSSWVDQYKQRGTAVFDTFDNTTNAITINERPHAVAWFSGRVWFAGIDEKTQSHRIFFTQVIEKDSQYGKCYQVADPTSSNISDLVDTDGGVISIPEIDNVHELLAYNGRLLVFADNGVWEISGGRDGYFTATGYVVRQITSIGAVNAESIVIAEGVPYYWSEGSIQAIMTDPQEGFLYAQDVSTGKIEKFLLELSRAAKENVQGIYDKGSKKVYWLYDSVADTTWYYANWLVMDLRLGGAFSKFRNYSEDDTGSIPTHIRAIYAIEDYKNTSNAERNVKFICTKTDAYELIFAELNDSSFQDFGIDAAAYLETGNDTLGDPSRRRYGRYLFTYMKRTETGYNLIDEDWVPTNPSALQVRYIWNWADSSNTGKWSAQQSAYKTDLYKYRRPWVPSTSTDLMGEAVVVNKNKIRGSGKVLRLRFDSVAGYDAHIYGWHLRQDITNEA